MVDLSVKVGKVSLKNPIMPASGCFSTDMAQIMDVNRLGALVAKTVSREYRIGNPPPRVAELECGMINSIGLPTKGIEYFLEHQVPDYARFTPPLVGSISATTAEDFEAMTREVGGHPDVDVVEVNISCPTRNPGGGNFAMHEDHTYNVTKRIRSATDKPVWVKLSPNAGDVVAIGQAAEEAGADALVVSNTLLGLKRPDEAIASYDRALAIVPDHPDVQNNRGVALLDLKRAAEALAAFDRVIALVPDFADAHYNRAEALRQLLRHDEALTSYDHALALNPAYAAAANKIGRAHV